MGMNVVLKMIVAKLDEKHGIEGWGYLPNNHPDIVWAVEANPLVKKLFEWTDERDAFLKDNFMRFTDRELGLKLGATEDSVTGRRLKLNMYKTDKGKRGGRERVEDNNEQKTSSRSTNIRL